MHKARCFFVFLAVTGLTSTIQAEHLTWGSSGGISGGSSGGWKVHHASFGSTGHLRVRYYGGTWGSSGGNIVRAHVRNLGSSGGDLEYAGPIKRFFRKMHEPLHHSNGSSGGRSYGSSGGSSGGVVISEKQPIDAGVDRSEGEISGLQSGDYEATLEADSANEQLQEGDSSSAIEANSQSGTATLTIAVPEAASVVINGHETKSTGETRHFRSVNLDSEETYSYRVVVYLSEGGVDHREEALIQMNAGSDHELDFRPSFMKDNPTKETVDQQSETEDEVNTIVRLHVPDDALVFLADRSTESSGAVRTFKTQSVKAGEVWEDYTIRVEWNENGKKIRIEKKVSIVGGTEADFHFSQETNQLASR